MIFPPLKLNFLFLSLSGGKEFILDSSQKNKFLSVQAEPGSLSNLSHFIKISKRTFRLNGGFPVFYIREYSTFEAGHLFREKTSPV